MARPQGQRILFARGPRLTLETFDVPVPGPRQVLVRITRSQVSAGSEMNYLRFGPAGYGKKGDLDATMAIGYQAVGRVEAIGAGITDFKVGDRVLTGGVHGTHWLVDCSQPEFNLEHIPDNVSDEAAGSGDLKIDPLIAHLITPAEVQATFETMLRGNDGWLGVVIKWT